MKCAKWILAMMEAASDRVSDVSRQDLDDFTAHLDQCIACRLALQEQRAVRDVISARADAEIPHGFTAVVLAAIALETSLSWVDVFRWRTWTCRLIPVATVLLLLGLVTANGTSFQSDSADESVVRLSELAETWAFGVEGATPAFTLWGQDNVAGSLLLDVVLGAEPDETLLEGNQL